MSDTDSAATAWTSVVIVQFALQELHEAGRRVQVVAQSIALAPSRFGDLRRARAIVLERVARGGPQIPGSIDGCGRHDGHAFQDVLDEVYPNVDGSSNLLFGERGLGVAQDCIDAVGVRMIGHRSRNEVVDNV